jgi:tricorn protease
MKKILGLLLICLPILVCAQSGETYFLSQPCLTPDGRAVVFSFEGDLWKASLEGGAAVRLTAMQGYETNARVSPDGQWIAFTGRQYGNADVYLMPVSGGEIKQLTFHSASDEVNSWSWDSKSIYFTSNRMGQLSGYRISIQGGNPERVFGNYFFQYDHNLFEHPSSGEIFFNDTWESSFQVQRKHYKGPFNPDIQSYNPRTKQYKRYTDYPGKDFGATLDRKGNIYFVSDEGNGEFNLYTFENGKKTALTSFSSSIKNPIVNADGGKVVFEKDYQLWVYDVAGKKSNRLGIPILRNDILPKEKDFTIKGTISNFDVSPDGKKIAFTARGELFVSDPEGKFIQQIRRPGGERAQEVKWLSDNRTLLFNQTQDGFRNLYTIAADGSAGLKQLTHDKKNDRSLSLDKGRTKAVYLSGRDEVRILNLKTWESQTIARDEIWAIENSDPVFSPDDRYVCYTAFRSFEQDLFVYDLSSGKSTNLTQTAVSEAGPIFSPDGKYIYFISSRLKPSYPFGMEFPKVYRLPLEKYDEPFRIDKYKELFQPDKKDSSKKDTDSVKVHINAEGIMDRIEQISPSFGSQYLIQVFAKGDKTTVIYGSDHDQGKFSIWKTVLEPFESPKTEKISGADGANADIVSSGDKYYILMNGNISKLNLDANKSEAITMNYTFRRNLSAEFSQIFHEAWADLDENYYDEKFHGLDWASTRDRYARFLPYLNTRGDLRILLNDMLGELNSSHQGFSTFGDDENIPLTSVTMETGILFESGKPYSVKYVIHNSAADKKDIDILPGDELVKVDGEPVDKSMARDIYFTLPSLDRELQMSFNREGKEFEVKVHPQTNLYGSLYDEWIENNKKRVETRSKGRIAYACMKNMGTGELNRFIIEMTKQLQGKDGLILDIRYNTGGNVHDEVLKFLSQRSYLQWKYREGKMAPQGNFAPSDKPIILMTNEQSLSDAEMTATGFKALKLGKIVGNETYHWIIFTSGAGLVDGSFVRLPSWGCYTLDGKDIEFSGVQPDIRVVNTFEDKINGRDPQLDRAIDEILKSTP